MTELRRSSGILLHPTSLPSRYGIGDLGPSAYRFVEFLIETGQRIWQILPLGHISFGNSPYMCFSAFGFNPHLIRCLAVRFDAASGSLPSSMSASERLPLPM